LKRESGIEEEVCKQGVWKRGGSVEKRPLSVETNYVNGESYK